MQAQAGAASDSKDEIHKTWERQLSRTLHTLRRKEDVYYADVVYVLLSRSTYWNTFADTTTRKRTLEPLLFTRVMNEWPLLSLASSLFVVERLKGLLKGQGEVQYKSLPLLLSRILLEHTGRTNCIMGDAMTMRRKYALSDCN